MPPDISPSLPAPLSSATVGADYHPTALVLPADLSYEDWEALGNTLARVEAGSRWWVGDWLAFGEHRYGEKYAQPIAGSPWKLASLQNFAWVSARFETSRRREVLSWSHHREVAALDPADQDALLDRAEAESWSSRDLRTAVRDLKRNRLPAPKAAEDTTELTAEELAEFGPEPEYDVEHELDLALKDIERLEALVESLSASDLGAEVRAWSAKFAQLQGRVLQLTRSEHEATRQAKWQADMLRKVRAALGVERSGEILPALQRLANTA